MLRLSGRNFESQKRPQVRPKLLVPRGAQSARDSPPKHPELFPHRFLAVELNAFGKQFCTLVATPFVESITETGAQRVAKQLEEDAFVLWRSPAPTGAREQNTPELPQYRQTPLLPTAQDLFQLRPQLFHFLRRTELILTGCVCGAALPRKQFFDTDASLAENG